MYIVISIFVTLALIIDFSIGNLPLELFKSPLNIIILLSIFFYIYIISNNKNKYQYILRIGSLKGVISIFVLFIIFILLSIFLPSTFSTHSLYVTSKMSRNCSCHHHRRLTDHNKIPCRISGDSTEFLLAPVLIIIVRYKCSHDNSDSNFPFLSF